MCQRAFATPGGKARTATRLFATRTDVAKARVLVNYQTTARACQTALDPAARKRATVCMARAAMVPQVQALVTASLGIMAGAAHSSVRA